MKSFCETWEKIHKEQEWGKYPSESVIRFIARNYYKTEREHTKILDFGCGGGANTWFLAREKFDVYAFDGSPSAVEKATRYLSTEGYHNVHFGVMDGAELTYEDDFFDCVVDNVCIYANYYDNICKMYQEIFRVLKSGGRLYSSCFGTQTEGYMTGSRLEEETYENVESGVLEGRAIVHFFSQQKFMQTIADIGFKNIQIDSMLYTDNGTKVEMFIAKAEK